MWILRSAAMLCLTAACSGCTSLSQVPGRIVSRFGDYATYKDREMQAHMAVKDAKRDALKAELDADREEYLQDQLYRTQALRGEAKWHQDQLDKSFDDSVQTTMNLGLEHSLQFGNIEVDLEKLQKLIAERQKHYEAELAAFEEQQEQEQLQAKKEKTDNDVSQASFFGKKEADCVCAAPQMANDCARPPRPQRTRPSRPQVTPTDIPMKIDVSMRVGLNDKGISKTEVRRLPQKSPCLRAPQESCTTLPMPCPPAEVRN